MSIVELLILLVIAGICGAIGQAIAGTQRGCLVSIVVGFIGALFGVWIANLLELPELIPIRVDEVEFPVIWSIIGAALFMAVISLVTKRRRVR